MPSLTIKTPDGKSRSVTLLKRITSLGKSADNDIVLDDGRVPETAFAIMFDGISYKVGGEVKFHVNGRSTDEHELKPNDVVKVGDTELVFSMGDAPLAQPALSTRFARNDSKDPDASTQEQPGIPGRELAALRRLTHFSERLLANTDLDRLLEGLMDECIDVARADKGFLILMESNQLRVKVARNVQRETIEDALERVSDSIVNKVVQQQKALIIADALDDPEFNASESVVNLKLLSVMCAPLMHKGELFGLIYLGNDRLVNRFDQKALDTLTIFSAQASLLIQNALLVNELKLENTTLKTRLEEQTYGDIVGACQGMKDVYKRIDKIAPTDISVLVIGETGTGKELIAKEMHRHSPRVKGPFISINCGAIPENLLESELFGHVKGAFTGAQADRKGAFVRADGGTLFLDELGRVSAAVQSRLLRVLEARTVKPVGADAERPVDVRVVAATPVGLQGAVADGSFRADLFYRLSVVTLELPPLRARREDLPLLVEEILKRRGFDAQGVAGENLDRLKGHRWPGNVRELRNVLERALVLSPGAKSFAELKLNVGAVAAGDAFGVRTDLSFKDAKDAVLEQFELTYLRDVMARNRDNLSAAARDADVDRKHWRALLKKHGLHSGGDDE